VRISSRCEYGLRAMIYLARAERDDPVPLTEIAAARRHAHRLPRTHPRSPARRRARGEHEGREWRLSPLALGRRHLGGRHRHRHRRSHCRWSAACPTKAAAPEPVAAPHNGCGVVSTTPSAGRSATSVSMNSPWRRSRHENRLLRPCGDHGRRPARLRRDGAVLRRALRQSVGDPPAGPRGRARRSTRGAPRSPRHWGRPTRRSSSRVVAPKPTTWRSPVFCSVSSPAI